MPDQQVGSEFRKFIAFAKVDEATHTVGGIATSEAVDSDGEIADYEGSKKAFTDWSNDFLQRTTASGQSPSLGNLRLQHQSSSVGGKVTKIDYKDDQKAVWVEASPINEDVWEALKNGYYTGFSIGGKVLKTKNEGKYTRFWFSLSELSVVDNPSNPDATFAFVRADGSTELRKFRRHPDQVITDIAASAKKTAQEFAAAARSSEGDTSMALFTPEQLAQIEAVILKKDGKTKRVAGEDLPASAFAFVGDSSDPSTWKLPIHFSSEDKSKRHVRNALARLNQTKDIPDDEKEAVRAKIEAAAKKYGIDVEGEKAKAESFHDLVKAALKKSYDGDEVKKSMWDVGILAETLSTLSYLYYNCLMEATWEEDDRDDVLAVELAAAIEHLVQILKDMVEEETSELIPALKAAQLELKLLKGENAMEVDEVIDIAQELADLAKAGHSLKASFKKMASHHEKMAAHHEKMAAHHESMVTAHKDMEEAHKACKTKKADGDSDGAFHSAGAAHHKTKSAGHEKMHKVNAKCMEAHKAMGEHCKAMSDHCSEETDNEKAVKAAAAATADAATPEALAKAAADKLIADKAAADKAAADAAGAPAADPTLAGVLSDLKKSIDAGNAATAKLQKSVEDMLAAPVTPGTPAAKATGIELVGRGTPPAALAKAAAADFGI